MDPRPPFPADPGFCPFYGEALQAEINRSAAAQAFRCVAAQATILIACILSLGLAAGIAWHQLARYEAALAACAGV